MSRFPGDLRGNLLTCSDASHAMYVSEFLLLWQFSRGKSDQKYQEKRPKKLYISFPNCSYASCEPTMFVCQRVTLSRTIPSRVHVFGKRNFFKDMFKGIQLIWVSRQKLLYTSPPPWGFCFHKTINFGCLRHPQFEDIVLLLIFCECSNIRMPFCSKTQHSYLCHRVL